MNSDLVFSADHPASTISSRAARGDLVRLAPGVYTSDTQRTPQDAVRAGMYEIAGRLVPRAVVTDRSARTGGAVDDVLYLARDGRARDLTLPGLTVRVRS